MWSRPRWACGNRVGIEPIQIRLHPPPTSLPLAELRRHKTGGDKQVYELAGQ